MIEIIAVIVIVAILAGIALVAMNSYVKRSHEAATLYAAVQVGKALNGDSVIQNKALNDYVAADFTTITPDLSPALANVDAVHLGVHPANTGQVDLIDWDGRPVLPGNATVCNSDYTYCVSTRLAGIAAGAWSQDTSASQTTPATTPADTDDLIFVDDPADKGTVPAVDVQDGTPNPDGTKNQVISVTPGAETVTIPTQWNGSGAQPPCSIPNLPPGFTLDAATCSIVGSSSSALAVQSITAGPTHTCTLAAGDGSVLCFGDNSSAALGIGQVSAVCYDQNGYPACQGGTPTGSTLPVQTLKEGGQALSGMSQLALGLNFSCARGTNSSLWCWGASPFGAYSMAHQVRSSGVVKVVAGESSVWILNSDGTVDFQKASASGQVQLPAAYASKVSDLAYGSGYLAVTAPGQTVYLRDTAAPATAPTSQVTVQAQYSGQAKSLTGGSDGGAICWVYSAATVTCLANHASGLTKLATTPSAITPTTVSIANVSSFALSSDMSCAVTTSGSVSCWGGTDEFGQRGDGAGGEFSTGITTATTLFGGLNVKQMSAGALSTDATYGSLRYGHACAVLADQTARCWGGYAFGEIGDGTVPGDKSAAGSTYPKWRSNPATVPVPTTDLAGLPRTLTVSWAGPKGTVTKNVDIKVRPATIRAVPGLDTPLKPTVRNITITPDPLVYKKFRISWDTSAALLAPIRYQIRAWNSAAGTAPADRHIITGCDSSSANSNVVYATSATSSCEFTVSYSVTPGSKLYVDMAVETLQGTGPAFGAFTSPRTVATFPNLPAAPVAPQLEWTSTYKDLEVTITPPASDLPLDNYQITGSTDGTTATGSRMQFTGCGTTASSYAIVIPATTTSCTLHITYSVAASQPYYIRVAAASAVSPTSYGTASPWAVINALPVPGQPTMLASSGSSASRTFNFTWATPSSPLPVTQYQIVMYDKPAMTNLDRLYIAGCGQPAGWALVCTAPLNSATITSTYGTPPGTYYIKINAGSDAGWGTFASYSVTIS